MDWMFVSSPNLYVETHSMVLVGGAFGRQLAHEGNIYEWNYCPLHKETSESSLTPSFRWGHSEKTTIMNQ